MEGFFKDLKHSLRAFAQSPAFTLAAIAALTLGIAANTAIFSVVNAVMLRPVSFPDADRVVVFMNTSPQGSGGGSSPAKFMHWRSLTDVVEDVSAYRTGCQLHRRHLSRIASIGAGFRSVFQIVFRPARARPDLHARRGFA